MFQQPVWVITEWQQHCFGSTCLVTMNSLYTSALWMCDVLLLVAESVAELPILFAM
jgi:hypothetical protein